MVRVPEYQRTERLRPAFQQGVDVRATPEAFGADIGRGLQRGGQALGEAADAIKKVQDFNNENNARDVDTQFSNWLRERTYGKDGFLTLEGKNAIHGRS